MAQSIQETNTSRTEIGGSVISHSNNPLTLEEGEDLTVTYALSGDIPTVTFSGTFKIVKTYDATTDTMSLSPYVATVPV